MRGECEAACLIDGNHLLFVQEGTIPSGATKIVAQTPLYDHCNFTVLAGESGSGAAQLRKLLIEMSYADPEVRRLLDLEGLKRWVPRRTEGHALLTEAVDRFGYLESFVKSASR